MKIMNMYMKVLTNTPRTPPPCGVVLRADESRLAKSPARAPARARARARTPPRHEGAM